MTKKPRLWKRTPNAEATVAGAQGAHDCLGGQLALLPDLQHRDVHIATGVLTLHPRRVPAPVQRQFDGGAAGEMSRSRCTSNCTLSGRCPELASMKTCRLVTTNSRSSRRNQNPEPDVKGLPPSEVRRRTALRSRASIKATAARARS